MPLRRRVVYALNTVACVLGVLVVVLLGFSAYLQNLSSSLPEIGVDEQALKSPEASIVYAADGSVLAEWRGEQNRRVVDLQDVAPELRQAVVAIEDRRFYEHSGVDVVAILRAFRTNVEANSVRQGGSTITQQLVKILFTDGERTLERKLKEALLAWKLEAKTDKDHVLEVYLNTIYFGNGSYGVESAARGYFNKHAYELSLAESALLAGIIQAPSRFDPTRSPDQARERRDVVLKTMHEEGYITKSQMSKASRKPVKLAAPRVVPQFAPHFVEYVKQDLIAQLGEERFHKGGLRVYTTLEPKLQRAAEKSARLLAKKGDPEVAVVSIRHEDGAVLAMVGGRDFSKNQFNLAAQAQRQPGSAFKPFVLAAAIEKGVSPKREFSTAPFSANVGDSIWNVRNYENGKTAPRLTLAAATKWSVNTVYARLIMEIGPDNVVSMAEKLGISSELEPNPAIALGGLTTGVSPLEMAAAYGTIASDGMRVSPTGIHVVTDPSGETVFQPDRKATRAISKNVARQTGRLLHEVVDSGTGKAADIGRWSAGKTGTTQSHRDAWFVGWSGELSTAVWVGYPEAQVPMTNVHGIKVTGGSYPARIWSRFMRDAGSVSLTPANRVVFQASPPS